MKRCLTLVTAFSAAFAASICASPNRASSQDVNFAGKTVDMTIGFAAGGGVDLYGRTLGRHLMQHVPGKPNLVVHNKPGAGGVVALNEWSMQAEPNGLHVTIGALSQTDPDALQRTKARFDPAKFKMVGGIGAYSQGLFVRTEAVKRLTDKSGEPVVAGLVGSSLRGGSYMILWGAKFLGWNVKWVGGYHSTGELRQAVERGEIDMSTFGASRDFDYLFKTGKVTVVAQTGQVEDGKRGKRAELKDAPIFSDLVRDKIRDPQARSAFTYWEYVSQVGTWLALPPGTSDAIVNAYVKAFAATDQDPAFRNEYSKIAPEWITVSKEDLEGQLAALAKVTPETLKFIADETKRQGLGGGK